MIDLVGINNETELQKNILDITKKVIDEVAEKVLNKLRANIEEIVYIGKNEVYARGTGVPTYQFLESWEKNSKLYGDTVYAGISQNIDAMDYEPYNYIHGDLYRDTRSVLAQYLFEGTDTSVFGHGWWEEKRDAWSPTIKLLENGTIDKWLISAFKSHGLQIKKSMSFADWATKYSK